MTTKEVPNNIRQSLSYTTQRTEISLLTKKTRKSQIWRQCSKRGNYQRTSGTGSHV